MLLQNFRHIDSVQLIADIMRRQLPRTQPRSKRTLGHYWCISRVPGPLHVRVTIIISVTSSVIPLIPDIRLLLMLIRRRVPRGLDLHDRVLPIPGRWNLNLRSNLPSGICWIIRLQLLVSGGVYTPVSLFADMR